MIALLEGCSSSPSLATAQVAAQVQFTARLLILRSVLGSVSVALCFDSAVVQPISSVSSAGGNCAEKHFCFESLRTHGSMSVGCH